MSRYYCMLGLFVTCLILAGCRRGTDSPHKQVEVELEKDILSKGLREKEILWAIRPLDRKSKIKGAAKEQKAAELEAYGKFAIQYLNKVPPKEYIKDEFYKQMRRSELFVQRKFTDEVAREIALEDVYLFRLKNTLVTSVDTKRGHIVAFAGAGGGAMEMGGEIDMEAMMGQKEGDEEKPTQAVIGTDAKVFFMKPTEFEKRLRVQALEVLWTYFAGYAGPLYVRPPANQNESDALVKRLGYRSHDAIIKSMQYGNPPAILQNIGANLPQLLKIPPEPRDAKTFRKYLLDYAPPSIGIDVDDRVLAVNTAVDWSAPNAVVACFTEADTVEVNQQKKVLGHLSIFTHGGTGYVFTPTVKAFLPPPPQKKLAAMPGMP